MAKIPFSDGIAFLVLDKLKDDDFVQKLVDELLTLFQVSAKLNCYPCLNNSFLFVCFFPQRDKGFDRSTFEKQMAVMRGQVHTLLCSERPYVQSCLSPMLQ